MSLLDQLSDPAVWQAFYEYKTSLACPKDFEKELDAFIRAQAYVPVCRGILAGEAFPIPRRCVISKMHSRKKRVVYIYPEAENTVLKLLTWLLLRKYDGIFSKGLYSFRPGRSAKDAIRALTGIPGIRQMYAYKADIHNYFNSVPPERLLPLLEEVTKDDPPLYRFLNGLLAEERVRDKDRIITEEKGIMAGTPQASFYANLYLKALDESFAARGIPYARYSDDIIVFGRTREETEAFAREIKDFLLKADLVINPEKECFYTPEDGWTFLGFSFRDGEIDIAPATVEKLKAKMRRKTRALARWSKRNGLPGERAAKAFIRIFKRKLLENARDNELTWSYWFFSVINTSKSLKQIDAYAQDCIRFLMTGKRTKARFNVRYEDMKAMGYRNLVHAYYEYKNEDPSSFQAAAEGRNAGPEIGEGEGKEC